MKKINISTKKYSDTYTLVDDQDFEYLNQWKWRRNTFGHVVRGNGSKVLMHKIINQTPVGYQTDHIDRNPLNNQRVNLRTTTCAQNQWNTRVVGVGWFNSQKKWRARIKINKKSITLGYFSTFKEALLVRKQAEIERKEWVNG